MTAAQVVHLLAVVAVVQALKVLTIKTAARVLHHQSLEL
jgi:hypothetical protein